MLDPTRKGPLDGKGDHHHHHATCSQCGTTSSPPKPTGSRRVVRWRSMYSKWLCGSCYLKASVDGLTAADWLLAVDDVCRDSQCGHGGGTNPVLAPAAPGPTLLPEAPAHAAAHLRVLPS